MKTIPLILVATLALACDGSPSAPTQPFTGTYVWLSSEGGIANQTRTPETEMMSIVIRYEGGRVRVYHNTALVAQTRYSARALVIDAGHPVYTIHYDPPLRAFPFDVLERHAAVQLTPTTVIFDDPCCDRWEHRLVAARADE